MHCEEVHALLDAYVDRELDVVHDIAIATHLQGCQACTQRHEDFLALHTALHTKGTYYTPRAQLHRRLRAALRQAVRPAWPRRSYAALAVALVLAVSVVVVWRQEFMFSPDDVMQDVIANHIRSLMVDHVTDVASRDPHILKPWFSDKLTFAPPIFDLTARGYKLVGARLDYLAERRVAAVVYQRRRHVINVFITPSPGAVTSSDPPLVASRGYHVLHWSQAGMTFWVVSDLNPSELRAFSELLKKNQIHRALPAFDPADR